MITLIVRLLRVSSVLTWRQTALLMLGLFAVANAPLLVGIDSLNWDASSHFGPAWTLVADHARAGKLLLWNPFIEGGSPDGVQPELGAFSPLTVGIGAVFGGTETGFVVYWLFVWLLGGLGILGLARHLGAPPWAGFVVACGYLFSATFTGHAQHTSWIHSYSFIPWVVWRLDVALAGRRLAPAAQAGALLGLSGLAGYPGIVVQTGVLAFLWTMGRSFTFEGDGRRARLNALVRGVGCLAVAALVATAVVAPSWFGFLAGTPGYTDRSGPLAREVVVHQNAFHPAALVTIASPYLHVVAALWAPGRWAPTDASSLGVYTGVAIPALAAFALARNPRRRWLWWLAGLALFLLAVSTDALPLRGLLYDLFPWERFARHGSQKKDLALFVLAVLALHGSPEVQDPKGEGEGGGHPGNARSFAVCTRMVALVAVAAAAAGAASLAVPGPRLAFALAHFLVAWGGLVVIAHLGKASRSIGRATAGLVPAALVLLAVLDATGTVRLSRVLMVDGGRGREVWDRISRERRSGIDLTDRGLYRESESPAWTFPKPNNQNVPLKVPVFANYTAMTNRFRVAMSDEPLLARLAVGHDRVWFTTEAKVASPGEQAWRELVERTRRTGSAVLVVHPPESMDGRASPTIETGGLARLGWSAEPRPLARIETVVHRYLPDDVELALSPAEPGWILFTDRWAKGWRAWIDGREVPVWGANLVFRAIRVSPGPRTVRFRYRPPGYPWLLLVSWGTLVAVAVGAAWRPIQGRIASFGGS